jgi:hypothetical protein
MRVKILDALDYDANYDNMVLEREKEKNEKMTMKRSDKFGLSRYECFFISSQTLLVSP